MNLQKWKRKKNVFVIIVCEEKEKKRNEMKSCACRPIFSPLILVRGNILVWNL